MNAALLKSEKMDWRTPDVILNLVKELGPINLDPSADPWHPIGRKANYTAQGLEKTWRGFGLAYSNPPYGRALPLWTHKAWMEFGTLEHAWMLPESEQERIKAEQGPDTDELVMLIPARTDTRWWQTYCTTADVICFWKGRITFVGAPHPAPFPSSILYWGARPQKFIEIFKEKGWCIEP